MYMKYKSILYISMVTRNILLIDKRVQNYEYIINSIDTSLCILVLFDYYTDTIDDIKRFISVEVATLAATDLVISAVGLVQHNYHLPYFNLVSNQYSTTEHGITTNEIQNSVIAGVETRDPTLNTWSAIKEFIAFIKNEYQVKYFDMMACALYSNIDWMYIIDNLSITTNVEIRASIDDTGASSLGGNWFLESHTGVNLKTVYFIDTIDNYNGLLASSDYGTGSSSLSKLYTKSYVPGTASYAFVGGTNQCIYTFNYFGHLSALYANGSVISAGLSTSGGTAAVSS